MVEIDRYWKRKEIIGLVKNNFPFGSDSPGIVWHQAKKKAGQVDSVVGENSGCMGTGITITSGCVGADITAVLADGDDPLGSDNLDSDRCMARKKADIIGLVKNNFPDLHH